MARTILVVLAGATVEAACQRRLLSMGELAARAGTSAKTLWAARRGRPVTVRTGKRIGAALRVPLRKLLADPAADAGGRARTAIVGQASGGGGRWCGLAAEPGEYRS